MFFKRPNEAVESIPTREEYTKNVVLIDMSYFSVRVLFANFANQPVDLVSLRYSVLFSVISRLNKMNIKYNTHEIIMCFDGNNYWRKCYAPYYKARRKEKDERIDWEGYFKSLDLFYNELKDHLPVVALKVNDIQSPEILTDLGNPVSMGTEADDIIAVLAKRFALNDRNVLIFSGDGDFTQLDKFDGVKIVNFDMDEVKAEHGCGSNDLMHKIVNGDSKDDVANINERSDYWSTRVDGERQKSAKKLAGQMCAVHDYMSLLNEDQKIRFKENQLMKSFEHIPMYIQEEIVDRYLKYDNLPKSNVKTYIMNAKNIQENLINLIIEVFL